MSTNNSHHQPGRLDDGSENFIAVVGMAGRFPESPDLDAFWANLRAGNDCLHTFTDEELTDLGIPLETVQVDNFVRRGTRLPDRDGFDARFFGYTPGNAAIIDPQARIFLETCYEALENSGYDPFDPGCPVGVFAGSNPSDYALLLGVADPTDSLGAFDHLIGVDRDFIATRVSHKLGLTGPAMTVQTACSTSLVTVHVAAQSLLAYECSMALAGGVSVNLRQGVGYFHQTGMILSPTGECRAFDARAEGTTLGQGCGAVVLKRLADAEQDGDTILAVIRATAINNDGDKKVGYTAPSEDGQVEVISMAHELAGVDSDSIGYVETHGTGTLLGDPIEIAALTRAFRPGTDRRRYCAIGSAKTNFGHTDAAAGITGFIKAVLTLHHREIPPSIHFDEPNPNIDFENSPFYVNTELRPFPSGDGPRRAGVSAFGIGGTNAHVVLEEAPRPVTADGSAPAGSAEHDGSADRLRVLTVSARSAAAADRQVERLAGALAERDDLHLADVDFTLRHGRPSFGHRRALVVDPHDRGSDTGGVARGEIVRGDTGELGPDDEVRARMVWLFAGQGAQYPGMGADLFGREPVFREAIDRVSDELVEALGVDLRSIIHPSPTITPEAAADRLRQTSMTQPALFAVEHAVAALLGSWGLRPSAVVGHSIGEYAAAVEAGIMSWADGARLVAERGRLMQAMPPGAMLSVSMPAGELLERLPAGAELAADNSATMSVASGPTGVIEALAADLEAAGTSVQLLHTSHAFHSAMMEEAAERFADAFTGVELRPPSISLISNVTGEAITGEQATDPAFWAGQIRRPVRFARCLNRATAGAASTVLVELGPGRALSTFASANQADGDQGPTRTLAVPTMRRHRQECDDQVVLLEAVGRLWTVGLDVDLDLVNGSTAARRVALPTYPFEREEAWLPAHRHVLALPHFGPSTDVDRATTRDTAPGAGRVTAREPLDRWLYTPSWQRQPARDRGRRLDGSLVVLAPEGDAGDRLVSGLSGYATEIVEVRPDASASEPCDERLAAVFADLADRDVPLAGVVHSWTAVTDGPGDLAQELDSGLHAALACARGMSPFSRHRTIRLDIVTAGAFAVTGQEEIRPAAASLLGPTRVVPLEYGGITTRLIDVTDGLSDDRTVEAVLAELTSAESGVGPDEVVALRGNHRWTPTVAVRPTSGPGGSPSEALDGAPTGTSIGTSSGSPAPRQGGRYLIVGGLGGVGLSIAEHLARGYGASLVLTGRSGRPVASGHDDVETLRRIELLERIEARAADLRVVAVDMTDEAAMTEMIDRLETDGPPINGIVVAAGVADTAGAIHRRSRADMEASIASKVHGLVALERAVGDRSLDFIVLSSSIAATLYHNRFAQVGYVAGNAFAEAFAVRCRRLGRPVTTVAWDDWLDVGMSVRAARDFRSDFGTEVDLVDEMNSFSPEDGVALFERALGIDEPVLLVSPTDLARRIADDVDVISPFLEQAVGDDGAAVDEPVVGGPTIELVSSVWAALLGFDGFDPMDDFFELGGDSLQAARMVDRLSRTIDAEIPVDLVFDNPRLTALADAIDEIRSSAEARSDPVGDGDGDEIRPRRLGPAQLRFLGRGTERPNHFNVSVLLEPKRRLDHAHVRAAISSTVATHSALRLSISEGGNGDGPRQAPTAPPSEPVLLVVDLSELSPPEAGIEMERSATEAQTSLDIEHGPTFRAVLYELPGGDQRLLVAVHHLMSDRISLLLIMDAVDAEIRRLAADDGGGNGSDGHLDRTDSASTRAAPPFLDWVSAQADAAATDHAELASHWLDRNWDAVPALPVDHRVGSEGNRNSDATAVKVSVRADRIAALTRGLGARPDEVVLLALARAVGDWSGGDAALIDVIGHGRRLPLGIDVSRSVGMFITYNPVLINGLFRDEAGQMAELRSDLERGWSFDALRFYGPPDLRERFSALPKSQILFNYVGQSIATTADALLVSSDEPRGPDVDPDGRRDHPLAVRADLRTSGEMELIFVYSERIHQRSTIEAVARQTVECVESMSAVSPLPG